MESQTPIIPLDEDGKTFDWKPRFNEPPEMAAVAEDVRPSTQQLHHYSFLAVIMRADSNETEDIVEALQYCERRHGFKVISPFLALVTAAIENAITLAGMRVTDLGIQRHLASPGLFVGSLIEEMSKVDSSTRRFPMSQYRERINSPYLEFEDCLMGAGVARKLGVLTEEKPQDAQPFSALIGAFRLRMLAKGTLLVDNLGREIRDKQIADSQLRLNTFAQAIRAQAEINKVLLPPQWRMYMRNSLGLATFH